MSDSLFDPLKVDSPRNRSSSNFPGMKGLSISNPLSDSTFLESPTQKCFDYLPDRKHLDYAEHTLALLVLLDQMPRYSYSGLDTRYTYEFFGETARRLVKELLHDGVPPDSTEEWISRLGPGFGFEDAMIRKY
ncbi:hypothetical protein E1B28_003563 [Marasmius oreades]|uniref:Uncharacterized protein n=1 Tax=Marasmius oreades TaxID=181124 RepID=A0A9P7UK17_9AGAR|nr:uncharacterized protein E1B28_003563 [Marasmius oreades]KAG7086042.1 hypothetical protein E1B28_003563 [Marasmius oreades]